MSFFPPVPAAKVSSFAFLFADTRPPDRILEACSTGLLNVISFIYYCRDAVLCIVWVMAQTSQNMIWLSKQMIVFACTHVSSLVLTLDASYFVQITQKTFKDTCLFFISIKCQVSSRSTLPLWVRCRSRVWYILYRDAWCVGPLLICVVGLLVGLLLWWLATMVMLNACRFCTLCWHNPGIHYMIIGTDFSYNRFTCIQSQFSYDIHRSITSHLTVSEMVNQGDSLSKPSLA